jgi:hypothetical protein
VAPNLGPVLFFRRFPFLRSMDKRVVVTVILFIAGIGVAGRAGGAQATPSTKTSATDFNACTLLTKQEAATAVGESVELKPVPIRGSVMPGVNIAACQYESAARHSVQVNERRMS